MFAQAPTPAPKNFVTLQPVNGDDALMTLQKLLSMANAGVPIVSGGSTAANQSTMLTNQGTQITNQTAQIAQITGVTAPPGATPSPSPAKAVSVQGYSNGIPVPVVQTPANTTGAGGVDSNTIRVTIANNDEALTTHSISTTQAGYVTTSSYANVANNIDTSIYGLRTYSVTVHETAGVNGATFQIVGSLDGSVYFPLKTFTVDGTQDSSSDVLVVASATVVRVIPTTASAMALSSFKVQAKDTVGGSHATITVKAAAK